MDEAIRNEDDFVYDVDAAQEHIDDAIMWIEEHGAIDEDDRALLLLASDLIGFVLLRGNEPERVAWIAAHRDMLDAVVAVNDEQ